VLDAFRERFEEFLRRARFLRQELGEALDLLFGGRVRSRGGEA
jgi:hypothetical protein